jgi:glutamyl-Q tRNA(Asp) synthetase
MLRIEDLDTPRVVKGSADDILCTLEAFGFEWDGEVVYQSCRFDAYEQALQQLSRDGLIYNCQCSRKSLMSQNLKQGPLGRIYPGFCRGKKLHSHHQLSQRLITEAAGNQLFTDLHYGPYQLDISNEVGDIVLRRSDGIYAYHLAVVLDDAVQQVERIVRGADLLQVTPLHLYLYSALGLSSPSYLHVPLITNSRGVKLSKQSGASALDTAKAGELLVKALEFLGQKVTVEMADARPREILEHAASRWQPELIPSMQIPG